MASVALVEQTICLMHPRYEDRVAIPDDEFDRIISEAGLKALGIYIFGFAGYLAMGIRSPRRLTFEELCGVETVIREKGIQTIRGALANRKHNLNSRLSLKVDIS